MESSNLRTRKLINELVEIKFNNLFNTNDISILKNTLYKTITTEYQKLAIVQLDLEDFTHVIYSALVEVEKKYDKSKNVPLAAYAKFILRNRILDYGKHLRRKKRMATIQAINSNRGEVSNSYISAFDKDVDSYSHQEYMVGNNDRKVRRIILDYLNSDASIIDKKIIYMMYEGNTQKEIMENLKINRKRILICKENLKKYFRSLIN
ncbi:hypothetical protein SLITO_v1c00310 [Spiroplasma litorale]|uniref:RNA polymerase sigma-70 region 2 domain-containing protein n=1 Tax=Spiroplasma litorale TaxID=216942 RepID=A0A0K1W061_9MOLU|nr:sigma factor [Spiroplasma litorale]AKX33699.1 hypothetical protein SLITO_v1c00310 [Spiroplasma litorale]